MQTVPGGIRLLLLAALAGGIAAPLASQTPPGQTTQPPQQNQPPATGLILGQVLDAGTGQPIAGAIVTFGGGPTMVNGQQLSLVEAAAIDPSGRGGGGTRIMAGPLGQFVFHSLRKGSYRLQASAPGYVPGGYGQRRVDGQTRPIELDEGEHVGDATIKLWKYASISGRVTDDAGEPAVGVSVRILRAQVSGVNRTYPTAGTAQTDDRGYYRVGTLIPGEYIVAVPQTVTTMPTSLVDAYVSGLSGNTTAALMKQLSESNAPFPNFSGGLRVGDYQISMMNGRPSVVVADDGREVSAFVTAYYPAAPGSNDTSVLKIASGQEQTGADLQLRLVRTVSVSGTVSAADGPMRNTGVRLIPIGQTGVAGITTIDAAATATDANGNFTFLGVPSGQYTLRVQRVPQPTFDNASRVTIMSSSGGMTVMSSMSGAPDLPPPTPPADPALFAELAVSVADHDVQDLAVTLRAGARVSGKIVFEGTAAPPAPAALQRMSPTLVGIDASVAVAAQGRTTSDGQFTTSGYPAGRYFVIVGAPAGPGWTLESTTLGGRSLDDSPLELGTSDVGGVVITFTDHPSELRGTVHAAGSATTATTDFDATVIVFPSNYRDWIEHGMSNRRQRTATVGKSGNFTISGLPAGDYLAVAVNPEAIESTRDPRIFDALARSASHFTLTTGEKKSLDLTVSQVR